MENLKNGTKITDKHTNRYTVTKYQDVILNEIGDNPILDDFILDDFIHHEFIILSEEDEEIDIQSIEEICIRPYKGFVDICNYLEEKGNELIKAIKQLDKKIKGKE